MAYGMDEENKTGGAFDDLVNQAKKNASGAQGAQERPQGVQDVRIILWGNGF